MKMPCELLTEPYIVRVRKTTAKLLAKRGWTQTAIATTLQLSQPVISNYLKSTSVATNHHINLIENTADTVARDVVDILILQGEKGVYDAITRICESCKLLRSGGPACSYHVTLVPELQLPEICTACLSSQKDLEYVETDRYAVIRVLNRSITSLNALDQIDSLIPEIGLQFVYGSSSISSIVDIAGFPGRLGKYRGKIIRQTSPEFGASTHTARLLLKAHQYNPQFRAVIGLKNLDALSNALNNLNIPSIELPVSEIHKFSFHNTSQLLTTNNCISIVELPAVGIEGISYLIGSSPDFLVDIITDILSALQ